MKKLYLENMDCKYTTKKALHYKYTFRRMHWTEAEKHWPVMTQYLENAHQLSQSQHYLECTDQWKQFTWVTLTSDDTVPTWKTLKPEDTTWDTLKCWNTIWKTLQFKDIITLYLEITDTDQW